MMVFMQITSSVMNGGVRNLFVLRNCKDVDCGEEGGQEGGLGCVWMFAESVAGNPS